MTAPPRRQVNATSTLRRNLNPSVIFSAFRRNLNPSVVSAHVVVVVVEPYAQQRAHAQAHMRARSPTTHHHLLAAGEAGFAWGQPLVKCPNPHARGRCRAQQRSPKPARRPRRLTGTRRSNMCACVYARPGCSQQHTGSPRGGERLIDCEKRTREPKGRTASLLQLGGRTDTADTRLSYKSLTTGRNPLGLPPIFF